MAGHVRLTVAYQGTAYHGWQVQPAQPTIQAELESAFTSMTSMKTRMVAAGRTDAGVHAAGQVVGFENPSRHPPAVLKEGLNRFLPEDIVVLQAEQAADGFDARRRAVGKLYRYTIHNHRTRPVFERDFRWHVKVNLDVEAMREAAACLVGEHDFSAFRASGCEAAHAVRRLDALRWASEGSVLCLSVWGRGFLKQMVRNIVGTLVEIGRGRFDAAEMVSILQSRDRTRAGPTAPARGLCLFRVYYREEEHSHAIAENS